MKDFSAPSTTSLRTVVSMGDVSTGFKAEVEPKPTVAPVRALLMSSCSLSPGFGGMVTSMAASTVSPAPNVGAAASRRNRTH